MRRAVLAVGRAARGRSRGRAGYANLGRSRSHSLSDGSLKEKLRAGQPVSGVLTTYFGDTTHVETLGLLGFDFLWAEAEHSPAHSESIARLILAGERRGLPTLVRCAYMKDLIGHVQKYLVAGAQGIILPQCENAADAEAVVEAVKFPPLGRRGLAGDRWNSWGLGSGGDMSQRVEDCNENSIVGVMIENQAGAKALPEILQNPEVDFVSLGPTDISADMGLHGDIRHPDVVAVVEELGEQIKSAGKAAGSLILNPGDYEYWRERDFQVMCCVAHTMFIDGARSLRQSMLDYEAERK